MESRTDPSRIVHASPTPSPSPSASAPAHACPHTTSFQPHHRRMVGRVPRCSEPAAATQAVAAATAVDTYKWQRREQRREQPREHRQPKPSGASEAQMQLGTRICALAFGEFVQIHGRPPSLPHLYTLHESQSITGSFLPGMVTLLVLGLAVTLACSYPCCSGSDMSSRLLHVSVARELVLSSGAPRFLGLAWRPPMPRRRSLIHGFSIVYSPPTLITLYLPLTSLFSLSLSSSPPPARAWGMRAGCPVDGGNCRSQ